MGNGTFFLHYTRHDFARINILCSNRNEEMEYSKAQSSLYSTCASPAQLHRSLCFLGPVDHTSAHTTHISSRPGTRRVCNFYARCNLWTRSFPRTAREGRICIRMLQGRPSTAPAGIACSLRPIPSVGNVLEGLRVALTHAVRGACTHGQREHLPADPPLEYAPRPQRSHAVRCEFE